jgi:hypothetical protein
MPIIKSRDASIILFLTLIDKSPDPPNELIRIIFYTLRMTLYILCTVLAPVFAHPVSSRICIVHVKIAKSLDGDYWYVRINSY